MSIQLFLSLLLAVSLTGCATTQRKTEQESLQSRVVELERKLEAKDSEIVDLQYEVKDLSSKMESKHTPMPAMPAEMEAPSPAPVSGKSDGNDIIRVNAAATKVQTALKNAGYYTGKIDGKVGSGTKAAVIAFQRAQGLTPDGIIGRRTWDALKQHLN